jgi:biotin operon repressor
MERNPALTMLKVLQHSKSKLMSDAELRKATGLSQTEIDLAAEELEEEGMIGVTRTYTLAE